MIAEPIKTAFPWYDDILKQNRYKETCLANCDFKLLTPLNTIPTFEIRTNENGVEIITWKVYCQDGSLADDITSHTSGGFAEDRININTIDGQDYISYKGVPLIDLGMGDPTPPLILSCGAYYSVLETNVGNYYSELFYCEDIDDPSFVQSRFPLFTPWRWYDNQEKQNRFIEPCLANCDFYLLTGNDALLPFMFNKLSGSNVINSWVLRSLDGTCEHNLDTALLNIAVFESGDYVYYNGEDIADLPCGTFESIITINGTPYYSELIKITNDISTNGDDFYILQEDGSLILQETNFGILQE